MHADYRVVLISLFFVFVDRTISNIYLHPPACPPLARGFSVSLRRKAVLNAGRNGMPKRVRACCDRYIKRSNRNTRIPDFDLWFSFSLSSSYAATQTQMI